MDNIEFETLSDLDKDFDEIKFVMKFENSIAQGQLTYIPPSNGEKIGKYNLKIEKNGKIEKNFDFQRMYNAEL